MLVCGLVLRPYNFRSMRFLLQLIWKMARNIPEYFDPPIDSTGFRHEPIKVINILKFIVWKLLIKLWNHL